MSVVAAVEFDDLVSTSESARKPQARHGRLRPAVDHAHLFDRHHPATDEVGHLHFERVWNSKAQTVDRGGGDSIHHNARSVAENRGAPAADVVDVFPAIDIVDAGALRALHE